MRGKGRVGARGRGDENLLNSKGDSEALDPDIRAFLRYVDGKAAEGAFVQALDTEVKSIKQHKETRREYMTLAMELKRQRQFGREEGREEGRQEERLKMILAMLRKGFSVESIAECAQTSVEYIMELGKKNHLL